MDDENIVELYLARDETALTVTQQKYGKRITSISERITGDRLTAEEVENDTYLRAWETIPPTEPRSYLFAYLARIARNLSISICRARSRLKRNALIVELSDEMEQCLPSACDVEKTAEDAVIAEAISNYLFSVSEEKRDMFMRRYWFADSVKDIARRHGASESKVKTTLWRMREELRKFLENEGIFV